MHDRLRNKSLRSFFTNSIPNDETQVRKNNETKRNERNEQNEPDNQKWELHILTFGIFTGRLNLHISVIPFVDWYEKITNSNISIALFFFYLSIVVHFFGSVFEINRTNFLTPVTPPYTMCLGHHREFRHGSQFFYWLFFSYSLFSEFVLSRMTQLKSTIKNC